MAKLVPHYGCGGVILAIHLPGEVVEVRCRKLPSASSGAESYLLRDRTGIRSTGPLATITYVAHNCDHLEVISTKSCIDRPAKPNWLHLQDRHVW